MQSVEALRSLGKRTSSRISAMTLCIAAACQHAGESRVVCCFDAKVGSDYEASESAYKFKTLSDQAVGMFSGPLLPAEDLISDYAQHLTGRTLTRATYREELWEPMKTHLANASKHEGFVDGAGDSPQVLVVIGIDNQFRLVSIDERGISEAPYFAAIGTGADSAISSLRWRKPDNNTSMHSVLYYAYEAKRFGEVSPHVGGFTYIKIIGLRPGSYLAQTIVLPNGIKRLNKAFAEFGPQPLDKYWHLPEDEIV